MSNSSAIVLKVTTSSITLVNSISALRWENMSSWSDRCLVNRSPAHRAPRTALGNSPPQISNDSASIIINANMTASVLVTATDPEGDTVTFNVRGLPPGGVVTKYGNTIVMNWTVTMEKLDIQIFARDDKGAMSALRPTVYLCACHNGGNCHRSESVTAGADETGDRFIVMRCVCNDGYTGRYCETDVDACAANLNPCYPGVDCIDLPAPANISGYKCGACPTGYTGDGAKCTDLDECATSNGRCQHTCVNAPGSFVCLCKTGYQLKFDKKSCEDINECVPASDCMHKCENTEGSYKCLCNEDFKPNPNNNKKCVAKNPCTEGDHGCQHVCYVSEGRDKCACHQGYTLLDNGKSCEDVNECDGDNRCNQRCHNKEGGYSCSCLEGFELSSDNVTCVDIDECMRWTFKCEDPSQLCENIAGLYKCVCAEGLHWINNTCTDPVIPPGPALPSSPRKPLLTDKQNAVNLTIEYLDKWYAPQETKFKKTVGEVVTKYCALNGSCTLSSEKRTRRSSEYITFTEDHVHLIPGFPVKVLFHSKTATRISFYVQYPPGTVPGDSVNQTISNELLVAIVEDSKDALEVALNSTILEVSVFWVEKPTEAAVERKSKSYELYYIIGGCLGGVLLLIVIIVLIIKCRPKRGQKVHIDGAETNEENNLHVYANAMVEMDELEQRPRLLYAKP